MGARVSGAERAHTRMYIWMNKKLGGRGSGILILLFLCWVVVDGFIYIGNGGGVRAPSLLKVAAAAVSFGTHTAGRRGGKRERGQMQARGCVLACDTAHKHSLSLAPHTKRDTTHARPAKSKQAERGCLKRAWSHRK